VDRVVKKNRWGPKRIATIVGGIVLVGLIVWGISASTGGKRFNVDTSRITVANVERAPFVESISATGNVRPRRTVFLDAVEGGRVEEIYVIEGSTVEKGQPLLKLSNNSLELNLVNADAQRIEQINRLQDTRFRMEQETLTRRQQLAQMSYEILRLNRSLERNQALYDKKLISEEEYDRVKDEHAYWVQNRKLTLQAFRADSIRMVSDIQRMENAAQRMEDNYRILERILDNLTIRAPVSGQLTALDAEIGELRSSGDRFGQIDLLDGHSIRAAVDEFYIARVSRGQTATTQPIAGKVYQLRVSRVYPQVTNGRFEVDLDFVDDVPEGIRRGQTVRFQLEMSDPAEALIVPKGGFFQSTGGNWVYVVDESGDRAVRRDIRLGRQNPRYYEVLEGLEEGDRVVTSSYDSFGDADVLNLD
jgi:HlyD family secretion protein